MDEAREKRCLLLWVLQFLKEQNYQGTLHTLEEESGLFFDMKHFEVQILAGEWEAAEKYLSGFANFLEDGPSFRILFEIRKQKYFEAMFRQDMAEALTILKRDLKIFSTYFESSLKECTELLVDEELRRSFLMYNDIASPRGCLFAQLRRLIEENPSFCDKISFPRIEPFRLHSLIAQSLMHRHVTSAGASHPALAINSPGGPIQNTFGPIELQPAVWGEMVNSYLQPKFVPKMPHGPIQHQNAALLLKPPRAQPGTPGSQTSGYAPLTKQMGAGSANEDDLPRTVIRFLYQRCDVTSMDFHPYTQTILLVGTNNGDLTIWDIKFQKIIVHKTFKIWESPYSKQLEGVLQPNETISINRCLWSRHKSFIGVAFSKHLIRTYAFVAGDLRPMLEINAHEGGGVNDIAFSSLKKSLVIISCGDDKKIKVWNLATGQQLYVFEGHEAPVYSICPHQKQGLQLILSFSTDGKMKSWVFTSLQSRINFDAPGCWHMRIACTADGTRPFLCGTNKEGEPILFEWNDVEDGVKRTYSGFGRHSMSAVHFDIMKNHFLAAGDECKIKFWKMNNANILFTTEADGGLPYNPQLRFSKDGFFLAVTTIDSGIKILANSVGQHLLKMLDSRCSSHSTKTKGIYRC